jgi:hypothetical protein
MMACGFSMPGWRVNFSTPQYGSCHWAHFSFKSTLSVENLPKKASRIFFWASKTGADAISLPPGPVTGKPQFRGFEATAPMIGARG